MICKGLADVAKEYQPFLVFCGDDNQITYLALSEILSPGVYFRSSTAGWVKLMEDKLLCEELAELDACKIDHQKSSR